MLAFAARIRSVSSSSACRNEQWRRWTQSSTFQRRDGCVQMKPIRHGLLEQLQAATVNTKPQKFVMRESPGSSPPKLQFVVLHRSLLPLLQKLGLPLVTSCHHLGTSPETRRHMAIGGRHLLWNTWSWFSLKISKDHSPCVTTALRAARF